MPLGCCASNVPANPLLLPVGRLMPLLITTVPVHKNITAETPTNASEPYKAGGVVPAAGKNPGIRTFPKIPLFPPKNT